MHRPTPLYERVKRHITDAISAGEYRPGERLPSENELVAALSVSRMTVNRALRELSRDGVITRVQGAGSFVSEPGPDTSLMEVKDIRHTIAERGGRHRCTPIGARALPATAEIAEAFGFAPGTIVLNAEIVHFENDAPLQIERRFVRKDFAPDFLSVDFETVSVFDYLQAIAPVSELEHVVEAARPDAMEARYLALGPGDPVIRVRRRTWVGDSVVTLTFFSHPGDRYRVAARVRPSDTAKR
ncbi:UTRA domain-containing protein [Kaustia mangrovi]|uniref:UTRA domain-containing protein n=1 Tax=Kaustia mangrovi TaxID=2593653 RepID=A0A7S8C3S1_9HYPH|nr:UTRA domain-containing protein [Kaustia mangrovi]QPC42834.1 UTRA domain-containing protein [Kaustia mangrovi]